MVDVKEIVDKMNVKEVIALVAGNTGGKYLNNVIGGLLKDENQRAVAKVAVGLLGSYAMNEIAERAPEYGEIAALAGLAFSAIAAQPISEKLTAEIAAATGTPIVVRAENPVIVKTAEPVINEEKPEEIAVEL